MGKKSIGRSKLILEDGVKREVERMESGTNWRETTEDKNRWQSLSLAVWF
jgi:hypothetical protein